MIGHATAPVDPPLVAGVGTLAGAVVRQLAPLVGRVTTHAIAAIPTTVEGVFTLRVRRVPAMGAHALVVTAAHTRNGVAAGGLGRPCPAPPRLA